METKRTNKANRIKATIALVIFTLSLFAGTESGRGAKVRRIKTHTTRSN